MRFEQTKHILKHLVWMGFSFVKRFIKSFRFHFPSIYMDKCTINFLFWGSMKKLWICNFVCLQKTLGWYYQEMNNVWIVIVSIFEIEYARLGGAKNTRFLECELNWFFLSFHQLVHFIRFAPTKANWIWLCKSWWSVKT